MDGVVCFLSFVHLRFRLAGGRMKLGNIETSCGGGGGGGTRLVWSRRVWGAPTERPATLGRPFISEVVWQIYGVGNYVPSHGVDCRLQD